MGNLSKEELQREFDRITSIIQSDENLYGILGAFKYELNELRESKKPASIKHHHSGNYGLLEHTIEVCKILEYMAGMYNLNKVLLLTAGLLHDLGKLDEYGISGEKKMKIDNGNINHTQYVYSILRHRGYYNLANIIGTHMGKIEWGAIKNIEDETCKSNWALHLADMMSTKLGD